MKKNSNIRCDMGKSIIHVKNSSGGFCKASNRGKIGKKCVYYGKGGMCNRYEKWCHSSGCPAYKRKSK